MKIDVVRSGKSAADKRVRLWLETCSKPSIRERAAYYCSGYIKKHIVPAIWLVGMGFVFAPACF